MAHTPGPWVVFGAKFHRYPGIEAETPEGKSRYSVVVWGDEEDGNAGVQGKTKDEAEANARLIAAAPDLYAAIKDSMEYLDLHLGPCDPDCEGILHGLRAAIAKAEGSPSDDAVARTPRGAVDSDRA